MIFLSHTAKDKQLIEPIALKLSEVYGQEKVFYDSWSIQPGDGIINKINVGLENCRFFFLFLSKNSLLSNLVSLEWQNAFYKAAKDEIKFIPVKIDDCLVPLVLMQSLYIDFFGQGFDVGLRQMIDIIEHRNTFTPKFTTFENVRGVVRFKSPNECTIEFNAIYYLEPISRFGVFMSNQLESIQHTCISDIMYSSKNLLDFTLLNDLIFSAILFSVERGTAPNFPFVIKISTKDRSPLKINALLRAVSSNEFKLIPTNFND